MNLCAFVASLTLVRSVAASFAKQTLIYGIVRIYPHRIDKSIPLRLRSTASLAHFVYRSRRLIHIETHLSKRERFPEDESLAFATRVRRAFTNHRSLLIEDGQQNRTMNFHRDGSSQRNVGIFPA